MTASFPSRLIGIQYAQAAAALAVVVFHACQRVEVDFSAGARGVDVFFVISGFIMWGITADRDVKPLAFIMNRLVRIAPLYWIATGVVIAASLLGLTSDQNDLSPGSIVKSLLFIPYIPVGTEQAWPILTPGWTLNFEMFFYAVFAAFLIFHTRWRFWGLSATFIALVFVGALIPDAGPIVDTYTSPLIIMFLAGVGLAEVLRRGLVFPRGAAVVAVITGGLALGLVPSDLGDFQLVATGTAATFFIAGIASLDLRGAVPDFTIPRTLGDASYSIYLWHGVALAIAAKVAEMVGLPPILAIMLGVVGGTIGGVLSYWLIEKPLLKALRPKPRVSRDPILV